MSIILDCDISRLGIQVGHEVTIALHTLLEVEGDILLFVRSRTN